MFINCSLLLLVGLHCLFLYWKLRQVRFCFVWMIAKKKRVQWTNIYKQFSVALIVRHAQIERISNLEYCYLLLALSLSSNVTFSDCFGEYVVSFAMNVLSFILGSFMYLKQLRFPRIIQSVSNWWSVDCSFPFNCLVYSHMSSIDRTIVPFLNSSILSDLEESFWIQVYKSFSLHSMVNSKPRLTNCEADV